MDASARSSRHQESARRWAETCHGWSHDAMKGGAALQSAMRRRLRREAATLNGQHTASLSLDAENVNDSVRLQKFGDLVRRRNFTKRRLFMAMQAYLCERNFRAGAMVDGIQPTCSIVAGCAVGNGFARVVLHDNLECANNTLLACHDDGCGEQRRRCSDHHL